VHAGNEKEASGRPEPTFNAKLSDERLGGMLQDIKVVPFVTSAYGRDMIKKNRYLVEG
jgi:hypothetical protein